jgi:radical SAM superfamily enzyme YgiQ (UPF0313 family)
MKRVLLVEPPGERGYLPLASGYLVAHALADERIAESFTFSYNFDHFHEPFERVLDAALGSGVPDIVGFSCQGWAVLRADALAQRVRKLRPDVTIVYGGNHVSHQAPGFFERRPYADVLVNGEGEDTFLEFLLRYLDDPEEPALDDVAGLSFKRRDGEIVVGPDRPRIKELDRIPSPYLTGALDPRPELVNTVMLETNRGCPYSCSYCYWGEAIGQKLHRFGEERLHSEMEFLAQRRIDSWFICDANFGIFPRDGEIVDEILALRKQTGFPKTVHTNWAKNSNERIVEMCARLNGGGVHSTYTLALQTTTEEALTLANRSNMKINKVDEIARLCREHDVVPRGELIWGLPGESYEDFLGSYDDLAEHTDALSVYPLYILPNTEYTSKIDDYEIVAERGELDTDYAYCVQHKTMTRDEFLRGLRFIISSNILKVGGVFFRLYPRVAKVAAGIPYHETIGRLGDWIASTDHPFAQRFRKYYRFPLTAHRQSLGETWHAILEDREGLVEMFRAYVEEVFHSEIDPATVEPLREAFRFDVETYPLVDDAELEQTAVDGFYVEETSFAYDLLTFKRGGSWSPVRGSYEYRIALPAGLWRYPMDNWYFGLISYQGHVTYRDEEERPRAKVAQSEPPVEVSASPPRERRREAVLAGAAAGTDDMGSDDFRVEG